MFEKEISEYFDKNIDSVIASMKEIMSIDSSLSEPLEGKPFGEGSAKALQWGANFGKSLLTGVRAGVPLVRPRAGAKSRGDPENKDNPRG